MTIQITIMLNWLCIKRDGPLLNNISFLYWLVPNYSHGNRGE